MKTNIKTAYNIEMCFKLIEETPEDYRDFRIDSFDKMFKQRNRYYNKLRK